MGKEKRERMLLMVPNFPKTPPIIPPNTDLYMPRQYSYKAEFHCIIKVSVAASASGSACADINLLHLLDQSHVFRPSIGAAHNGQWHFGRDRRALVSDAIVRCVVVVWVVPRASA